MKLGALAFGAFSVFIIVVGVIFIVSMAASQPDYSDTYGNTIGNTGNQSQDLVDASVDTSGPVLVYMLFIAAAILLIAVLVGLWMFSKTGISI